MGDEFSLEEQELLKPFVSNIDSPIFVLRNLPEVIKGALFSRYSRSTKGLRRLLLDEFIQGTESGFNARATDTEDLLDIQRAQAFYDRILDGYGDDSIGELGGAHLALENVSILATKNLENPRIGGSPLEKSTRYVYFDQQVHGDYLYYKEPRIMDSRFADDYVRINRLLFSTYSRLIPDMMKFLETTYPKDANIPESAYRFTLRAKACDALRALLPASTLTNMGIFGNGRFFESLIVQMECNELTEMRNIATDMRQELGKVIPSFIRRSDPQHMFFEPFQRFIGQTREDVRDLSREITSTEQSRPADEVRLLHFDTDAEERVLMAIIYPHCTLDRSHLKKVIARLTPIKRQEIIDAYCRQRTNRRHKPGRAFENAVYSFDLQADYGVYRDLHRHRMLTQERQELGVQHGYIIPPEIIAAGMEKDFVHCMDEAAHVYQKIYEQFPREAQYVVPLAYKIRWYVTLNLRELYWLCELRTVPQGHPNYRRVVQNMFKQVQSVHPNLVKNMTYVDMNDYSLGRLKSEIEKEQRKMDLQHQ